LTNDLDSGALLVKMTEKHEEGEAAARAVGLQPYKTSEISNRLAGLRAKEQYHPKCARAIIWRTFVLILSPLCLPVSNFISYSYQK
jgi:hypothetical protein